MLMAYKDKDKRDNNEKNKNYIQAITAKRNSNPSEYEHCIDYCDTLIGFIDETNMDTEDKYMMWICYHHMAKAYFRLNNFIVAYKFFVKSKLYATNHNYLYQSIWFMAMCCKEMGYKDKAVFHYDDCLGYFKEFGSALDVAKIKGNMAMLRQDDKAMADAICELKIHEKETMADYTADIDNMYDSLAHIYINKGMQTKAYNAYKSIYNKHLFMDLKMEVTGHENI